MPSVVLQTDVHCRRCAKKTRKSIINMLEVDRVRASPETGTVLVYGTTMDAPALRRRIERRIRRPVAIVSDGPGVPVYGRPHFEEITHLAPPPPPPPPPAYGGWVMAPPHVQPQYTTGGNRWDPYDSGYVPSGGAPTCSIL